MLEAAIALLAGLLIGSFLNVCIYRMPRDLSVVAPRSYCPECEHPIAWYDNIPVLSYILLRGRCRACLKPIRPRYLVVELITPVLFAGIIYAFGATWLGVKLCVFAAINVVLAFSDLEERILPETFTLGAIPVGLALAYAAPVRPEFTFWIFPAAWGPRRLSVLECAMGGAFVSGLLWSMGKLYQKVRHREGLGLGDVSMMAMAGAFLGIYGAVCTLMLGSLLGSVIGVIYVYATRKDFSTYELPFGSFLASAAVAVALLISSLQIVPR
jgi:leader peptidase (prepilin peptidase)/N-methyltransferase